MDPLTLTPETIQQLVLWARQAQPSEACGVIFPNELLLCRNDADDPTTGFVAHVICRRLRSLDGVAFSTMTANWHSHPTTRAFPSPEDCELMRETGIPMVIVSLASTVPAVCVFVMDDETPTRIRKVQEYRTSSLQSSGGVL